MVIKFSYIKVFGQGTTSWGGVPADYPFGKKG
jgi:hypothetical protein